MAYKKVGTNTPYGGPVLFTGILQNSDVFTEDDICKVDSNGFLTTDSINTAGLFGHVDSLVTFDGVGLTSNGGGSPFAGTFTADSSNETTGGKVSAVVDISQMSKYSVTPDATVGTNNTELLGYYVDAADEFQTDEDTGASTVAQFYIWGLDPKDSTKHVVSIFESEVFTAV